MQAAVLTLVYIAGKRGDQLELDMSCGDHKVEQGFRHRRLR